MTASSRKKRTIAFEEGAAQPVPSGVAESSEVAEDEARASLPFEATNTPIDLERSLLAPRTPLIAGVDYAQEDSERRALLPARPVGEAAGERARVDTLSPLDSVPPPAPYMTEAPRVRPAVVPPVRSPYNDPQPRTRSEPPPRILRSDPPPRIPISDRPPRASYSSNPPPRLSHSERPPPSSGHGASSKRGGWGEPMPVSADARRREAVTVPADAHSPSQMPGYEPSLNLSPPRVPNFGAAHLPDAIRQHENSRLRHVAMAMMFVIFIVMGAIGGMRWYVARDHEAPTSEPGPVRNPRSPQVRVDRHDAKAVIPSRAGSRVATDTTAGSRADKGPTGAPKDGDSPKLGVTAVGTPETARTEPESTSSPSAAQPTPSGVAARAKRASKTAGTKPLDTKTPLIND
jgi:hypothetical protein